MTMPPIRSSAESDGRKARKARTGVPSAEAAAPSREAPISAPARPATGIHGELSGRNSGATNDPTIAPMTRPPRDSACAASPR